MSLTPQIYQFQPALLYTRLITLCSTTRGKVILIYCESFQSDSLNWRRDCLRDDVLDSSSALMRATAVCKPINNLPDPFVCIRLPSSYHSLSFYVLWCHSTRYCSTSSSNSSKVSSRTCVDLENCFSIPEVSCATHIIPWWLTTIYLKQL